MSSSTVPEWYVEMVDPDFHREQCVRRAETLRMMRSDAGANREVSGVSGEESGTMAVQRYVVVENTPGYLPEEDDPATFEDLGAASEYLVERVRGYAVSLCESYEWREGYEPRIEWGSYEYGVTDSAMVTDPEREHDLGRVFEILPVEGGA